MLSVKQIKKPFTFKDTSTHSHNTQLSNLTNEKDFDRNSNVYLMNIHRYNLHFNSILFCTLSSFKSYLKNEMRNTDFAWVDQDNNKKEQRKKSTHKKIVCYKSRIANNQTFCVIFAGSYKHQLSSLSHLFTSYIT